MKSNTSATRIIELCFVTLLSYRVLIWLIIITFLSETINVDASTTASTTTVMSSNIQHLNECSDGSITDSSTTRHNLDLVQIFESILANNYDELDGTVLLNSIETLKDRGAHRCWHKHSTFLEHLVGVHNILRLWGQGAIMGRVGLFHSAYSNSYVNLALFDPLSERSVMQELIGSSAEELVHLFCIIDRQQVVVNTLLKLGYIPMDGLSVPHLRNKNEQVYLSPEKLRMLAVFSMADIAEQYFGWQDELFGGDGYMLLPGKDHTTNHNTQVMWPGVSKPGIWMTYVNQLAMVARSFQWSGVKNKTANSNKETCTEYYDLGSLDIPPVFDNCTKQLTVDDEVTARDLYWSVVMGAPRIENDIIATLLDCRTCNPWIFEPLVLLAQQYLHQGKYGNARLAAQTALQLQHQWGTAWDKRLQFGAWVAWTRVLHQRAIANQPWPTNSWDVNNFGFVQ